VSFGRHLVNAVLRSGNVRAILSLAGKIAVPTILYAAFLDVSFYHVKWPGILLLGNWLTPGFAEGGFRFWYLDVLVQSLLVLAAAFAIPAVRDRVQKDAFSCALAATMVFALVSEYAPALWNTRHLYDQVPHMYLGAILLGWAVAAADSRRGRLLVLAATLATFAGPAMRSDHFLWLPFVAVALINYCKYVSVPRRLATVMTHIAGASLFVYLTDYQVQSVLLKTRLAPYAAAHVAISVVVGWLIWRVWERAGALGRKALRARLGA
jgi:hypothetical protein